MYCPRIDHNVRLNQDGSVSLCGHMIGSPKFPDYNTLFNSHWLTTVRDSFDNSNWPIECQRCKQTEEHNNSSIRLNMLKFQKLQKNKEYLVVGGVLDNICNSACQTCNENLSTKIGSLKSKTYPIINNTDKFWTLPLERVTHLDINGGEPSASKNYKKILKNLPPNVESIRVNTNCSTVLPELLELPDKGIHVTVTVSLDGVGQVHDYIRWPISWDKFVKNLLTYKSCGIQSLNTWTTVSALNIGDFENILDFVNLHQLEHSWAPLVIPSALSVEYQNHLTIPAKHALEKSNNKVCQHLASLVATKDYNQEQLTQYIMQQDALRNISITDFIK